ncbi:hypothetical protein FVQ98_14595 [Ottowia sp. GY511]|uniref:Uncharacterized protein n=1 Tax=Ottowia flava TaxID=2675430 RepID=A0ABW4KS50_9BURK|nr:hypothetical protein [Ottowia sp. GY511]TXK26383.1 hypothetical protein FVQ98_14595 [Ottowia sp. GY511]
MSRSSVRGLRKRAQARVRLAWLLRRLQREDAQRYAAIGAAADAWVNSMFEVDRRLAQVVCDSFMSDLRRLFKETVLMPMVRGIVKD